MPDPRVSILIPTFNGERHIDRLLPVLLALELDGGYEIRVVDSDSADCTRQILRKHGIPVERIERSEFGHGKTRNHLAESARGELCVFLSQDVVPGGEDFLERLLEPLADPDVAGSTSRVMPHATDDPLTARTVLGAPEAGESGSPAAYQRFNNVASCIRRSVLAEIPFPDVPFGEDIAWAKEALAAGWKIAYAPDSVVHHAHRYTPRQAFERYRVDADFHRRTHDRRLRPSLVSVLRGFLYELHEDWSYVRRNGGFHHLLRSPALRGAQVLGQYFGSHGWNPGGSTHSK